MGSFPLFRLFGVQVYLHWLWLIGAVFIITSRSISERYGHIGWTIAEYLGLFGIVLLHEFGHALACRSVGGRADHIVLWPLGGIAFVDPPPRPGPVLWSIAAGPLVNVALLPVFWGAVMVVGSGYSLEAILETPAAVPDIVKFAFWMAVINTGLLVFNMLPVYPLDGGQILQALLWFVIGRPKSLLITASLGLVAAVVGGLWALSGGAILLALIAIFVGLQSVNAIRLSRLLAQGEDAGVRM